jgi:hypothetical protein
MALQLKYFAIALATSTLVFACSSSDDDDNSGGSAGTGGGASGSGGSVVTGGSGGGETGGTGGGETGGTGGGETGGTGGGATGGTGGGTTGGYGSLTTVSMSSAFIFDGSKLSDQAYLQGHMDGVQMSPAFTGTYTTAGSPIPPAGTQTLAVATHMANPPSVGIIQQSLSGQTLASPMVQMMFASDVLASGPVDVGLEQTSGAQLFVMDSTGAQSGCIAAIGIGQVQVTNAVNTNATDGGQLALQGANIALYHPSDTPYGNIQADLEAQMAVCPFK